MITGIIMIPRHECCSDGILEDLVDAKEGKDTGLEVGHAQLLSNSAP